MNPYLSPTYIRAALASLNLRPTRGMGQNFLIDGDALEQIVAAAELTPDETALEVGPGLGVLTWELVQRAGQVVAVELDKRLAARLREEFAHTSLRIVQADVLHTPPESLLAQDAGRRTEDERGPGSERDPASYKLVANLPYAITQPVLRHFLEAATPPELSVVMVQWEVAQRITARPGDLSLLAHAVQFYAAPEIVARVSARSFMPVPAVDSAILRLRRWPRPPVDVASVDGLFRVIKAAFLQTRKQLGNGLPTGLAALGTPLPRDQATAALRSAGIDPQRRAETLALAEWAALYAVLRPLLALPNDPRPA